MAWCCLCDGSDGSASIQLERDATCDGVSLARWSGDAEEEEAAELSLFG